MLTANRPDEQLGDDVFQALVVRTAADADVAEVAAAIDAATGGATESLTITEAIDAIPGVEQQRSTFNQIIGVTVAIAVVVVALFFALLTVERLGLYGVLKAIGARSRTLFAGLVVQAVVVTAVAVGHRRWPGRAPRRRHPARLDPARHLSCAGSSPAPSCCSSPPSSAAPSRSAGSCASTRPRRSEPLS